MRIIVVDDHPLVRKGVISILAENSRVQEILEASNVNGALELIRKYKPNVVLIDLKLDKEEGLEVAVHGRSISPETKYVILTSFISQTDFLKAEEIGIEGYMLKQATVEDITYVVDLIFRGKKYYDPDIISYYKKGSEDSGRVNLLTDREKEVLAELSKGLTNEEIAECLYISENTVKKHISSILSKFNLKHRTQAALLVKSMGI